MPLPAQYQEYLNNRADFYGIPRNVANAVVAQESGGSLNRYSSAGAYGPMQLMPGTAADLGVNRYNPFENIDGGLRYLREQLDRFGGNLALALSAYNSGPGGSESRGQVENNPETQNYVDSILGRLGELGKDMFVFGHDQQTNPDGSQPIHRANPVTDFLSFLVNLFSKDTLVRTVAIIIGVILLGAAVITFVASTKAGKTVINTAGKVVPVGKVVSAIT